MRITALVGGLTLAAGLLIGWKVNGWRLEARIADLQASYALAYSQAQKAARNRENALTDDIAKLRKSKDAQIANISNRLAVAVNSLQDRPSRPANGVSANSTAGLGGERGCTASELYREDAESFIKFSATTEEIKEALKYCAAQYNSVRDTLNKK